MVIRAKGTNALALKRLVLSDSYLLRNFGSHIWPEGISADGNAEGGGRSTGFSWRIAVLQNLADYLIFVI